MIILLSKQPNGDLSRNARIISMSTNLDLTPQAAAVFHQILAGHARPSLVQTLLVALWMSVTMLSHQILWLPAKAILVSESEQEIFLHSPTDEQTSRQNNLNRTNAHLMHQQRLACYLHRGTYTSSQNAYVSDPGTSFLKRKITRMHNQWSKVGMERENMLVSCFSRRGVRNISHSG